MASKSTWQQQQAELKKAAVTELLNRPDREPLAAAIRRISKAYNGKRLSGKKRFRLSCTSLKRLWYKWKNNPSDSLFDLNYAGGVSTLIQPWISHLLTEYAIHHGLNISQAFEQLKATAPDLPFASCTMQRHISNTDRKRIATGVQLRKRQAVIDKETEALSKGIKI